MRLVPDINIAVSGLVWLGPSSRILEAASDGETELFATELMLSQLEAVLRRRKFVQQLLRRKLTIKGLVDTYRDLTTVVEPADIGAPVVRDPDDLAVLACAVAANADMIVSGDDDLLVLREFRNIPIVKPVDAARTLGYKV